MGLAAPETTKVVYSLLSACSAISAVKLVLFLFTAEQQYILAVPGRAGIYFYPFSAVSVCSAVKSELFLFTAEIAESAEKS